MNNTVLLLNGFLIWTVCGPDIQVTAELKVIISRTKTCFVFYNSILLLFIVC